MRKSFLKNIAAITISASSIITHTPAFPVFDFSLAEKLVMHDIYEHLCKEADPDLFKEWSRKMRTSYQHRTQSQQEAARKTDEYRMNYEYALEDLNKILPQDNIKRSEKCIELLQSH